MSYVLDSYTKLYIPFNGTDGDTDDQTALTGQTVSLEGNAQLDTDQKKFGTASLLLDGIGDYATVPDHADWNFGTGDFTIDTWVMLSSLATSPICGQQTDTSNRWDLIYSSERLMFIGTISGSQSITYTVESPGLSTNIWYHLELVRSGTNIYIFINGVSQSLTIGDAIGTQAMPDLTGNFEIGAARNHGYVMAGWIDEFRISKGIARHTVNFIPHNEANFLGMF